MSPKLCFWFVAYLYAYKNVLAGPVVELSIDLFLRIVECVLLNYVIDKMLQR